jgi:hypothetical protein
MKAQTRPRQRIILFFVFLCAVSFAGCNRSEGQIEQTSTSIPTATARTARPIPTTTVPVAPEPTPSATALPIPTTAVPVTPEPSPSAAAPSNPTATVPVTPEPSPSTTGSSPPTLAASVSELAVPLLIDGEKGWIFASARVDGQPKTVKLSTEDGRLLAAFDVSGRLALDRAHGRVVVDRGEDGVAILNASDGSVLASVRLPAAGPANADPQVEPTSGHAFVFRGDAAYVIDTTTAQVLDTESLDVALTVCGDPGGPADVERSFYDLVNHRLYLAFTTYVCTPWVHQTLVAYDAATLSELGRYQTELRYQAVPFSDSLYGTTAGRLGLNVSWAWNGHETWFQESRPGSLRLQGIVADWKRQLLYEAIDGQITAYTPYPREPVARVTVPELEGGARLAGHDPITDQLYFLNDGELFVSDTDAVVPGAASHAAERATVPR